MCDNGPTCNECSKANASCQRARCDKFEAGTCHRKMCTRAHENDEGNFAEIVAVAGHVSRVIQSPRKARLKRPVEDEVGSPGKRLKLLMSAEDVRRQEES